MSTQEVSQSTPETLDRKTLLALVDASRSINRDLDVHDVFKRIVEHAAAVLEAEGASVLIFDAEHDELVFKAAVGPAGKELLGERIKAGEGIAGQVVKTGRAVRVDDVRLNRNFFPEIDAKTKQKTLGIIAAPLVHNNDVLGVVEVLNPTGRSNFTDRDLELVRVFANLAAAAARNAQQYDKVSKENLGLRRNLPATEVVGQSEPFTRALDLCRRVAATSTTVLITGETGTGKEVAARIVHEYSPRSDKPFIAINCAALPENLLESELFGHEKGAFTGASSQRLGRFELADGGTLFLDEIGEVSPSIQAKLLRVLQEREFVRVGGTATVHCDVRIVAATNRDLRAQMAAGNFREDLFYRLNVFPINLPPLRQRVEDLPLLVNHFINFLAPQMNVRVPSISNESMQCLCRYAWPGNIRELRNVIERCTLLADGEITPHDLPAEIAALGGSGAESAAAVLSGGGGAPGAATPVATTFADHEKQLLIEALEKTRWNQSAAARNLGISRDHLRYRIKKYNLTPPT